MKFSLELARDSAEFSRHTTNIDYDNIEVVDDYTIILPLVEQNVLTWNDLTRIDIVSQADFEESSDHMITTPVGTGPYRVVSYTEALKDGDEAKVAELVEIFTENMPIYPLYNKTNYYVYRKGMEDVKTKDDYVVFPGDVTYSEEAEAWLYD